MAFTTQDIWETIRRARLIRVLVIYIGASFAALEIVSVVADQVGLPDWVIPFAFVLLLIGLPIMITTAVVQSAPVEEPTAGAPLGLQPEAWGAEVELQPTSAEVAAVAKHWLTWRRALLGGLLAFALWGVVVTGYMTTRALGIGPVGSLVAAGVLEERDRIILADFQDHTGDPTLATTVTETFRVDLAQSPAVTIVQPRYVRQVLGRMQVDPDSPLDPELASEVAVREGIKAVVTGEVNPAGSGYVLSTQLVSAETGEVHAAFRVTADDSSAIIGAIDRLSKKLRERIGESLKTIRANEPLAVVTTGSLEALLKYSQAVRALDAGDIETGVTLLEEAVALDSTFAMAWRKLGVGLGRRGGERARQVAAYTKAYELRDRLTDRERYHAIGVYQDNVREQRQEAIAAYRALLDTYPDDQIALNNLAVVYEDMRDFAGAEELYRRAVEVDSFRAYYINLIEVQAKLGRFEDAEVTLSRLAEKLPDHPNVEPLRGMLAYSRGDYETASSHFRAYGEQRASNLRVRANTAGWLALVAQTRGQLAEAERHWRDQAAADEQRGLERAGLIGAINLAWLDVWLRAQPDRGLRIIEEALERHPLAEFDPIERPYQNLAALYAFAGRHERTAAYFAEWEAEVDPEIRRTSEFQHALRGYIALAEGRADEAIQAMRLYADREECVICALTGLAYMYDQLGQADSALAVYERYVTTPWSWRFGDSAWLHWTYERLGQLYEARGQTDKAMLYYGRFVELWQDADPELQPRVEAARRAIEALSADR